ncbi:serine/threonine protein kinase [Finch poxvirus]|uniref:non-specific serine/threonine protein kinase n=2 Tax=unclassified Avipoxvirus TaxID=336487 RepID=A0AAT9URC8_9POXV|nr:serine/threonine protein kinase [Finch poxvirus]UOX39043.1 serine/threonine protein kinase [Finch poxvirus]
MALTNKKVLPLPSGTVLTDLAKKRWVLEKQIGCGGFGLVYDVRPEHDNTNTKYIAKLEHKDSGGLFCEINFYIRVMRSNYVIDDWKKNHLISHLGIPKYYGSGISMYNGKEYRFLIIEKLGSDIHRLLVDRKKFNISGVKTLATNLLTILEFIHDKGYSHGDIKSENILLGLHDNRIYLVDYGLSAKFLQGKEHRPYFRDPKARHNGTLLFASVDAHNGAVVSRKGDLESLGYCMIKWLVGRLPWEGYEKDPDSVQNMKEKFIENITKKYVIEKDIDIIYNYIKTVSSLDYSENPDYDRLKKMFL